MFLESLILSLANGRNVGYTSEKTDNSAIYKARFKATHNPLVLGSNPGGPIH
jgi:hypothetical protein